MFYEPDAVERALVAAGYEPRPSDGHFLVVLKRDSTTDAVFELHVEPRGKACFITIRYLRRLLNGAKELQAIVARANDLGWSMMENNPAYAVGCGYAENTHSATVDVKTCVFDDETLVEAINCLLARSADLFDQLESAGRPIH